MLAAATTPCLGCNSKWSGRSQPLRHRHMSICFVCPAFRTGCCFPRVQYKDCSFPCRQHDACLHPYIQCAGSANTMRTCGLRSVHMSCASEPRLARGLVLFVPCTGGDHDTVSPISILSRDEGSTNHWSQSPGACLHAHVSAVVGQERCCGFKPTLLVFDFLSPVCSARERPQLSSADEFRGQPTTHFAAQDLLCTMLPITWGSGVGAMVFDAPFFRLSARA